MKRQSVIFALALLLSVCCGPWAFAGSHPGSDSEPSSIETFCGTINGIEYVAQVTYFDDVDEASCQKLSCGQSVAAQVTVQYYTPCPNDPALGGPLAHSVAQDFADDYCAHGIYCCPFGSACYIDCRPENVTWICNDPRGIMYVTFNMVSECVAPTRP